MDLAAKLHRLTIKKDHAQYRTVIPTETEPSSRPKQNRHPDRNRTVIPTEQAVSQLRHRTIILFAISAKLQILFVNRFN